MHRIPGVVIALYSRDCCKCAVFQGLHRNRLYSRGCKWVVGVFSVFVGELYLVSIQGFKAGCISRVVRRLYFRRCNYAVFQGVVSELYFGVVSGLYFSFCKVGSISRRR